MDGGRGWGQRSARAGQGPCTTMFCKVRLTIDGAIDTCLLDSVAPSPIYLFTYLHRKSPDISLLQSINQSLININEHVIQHKHKQVFDQVVDILIQIA